MARKEELDKAILDKYGEVDKTYPISEFRKDMDRKAFREGFQLADDTMIEKACEWLASNIRCDGYTLQTKAKLIANFRKAMEELNNCLKSLKDRHAWKPSEEQMEALLSEVTAWTKGCHKQKVLESLYNDLRNSYGR